jgi:hypothetical protein
MTCINTCLFTGIILSSLVSIGFTSFYTINDGWIQNWREFGICPELPISLAACQIGNLIIFFYAACKIFLKCSPCCFLFNLITIVTYIFSYYIVFSGLCYDDYIHTYPNLLHSFWVQIAIQSLILVLFFLEVCLKQYRNNFRRHGQIRRNRIRRRQEMYIPFDQEE